ncbi:hypothetical protein [Micromonospora parastrephiae]|uniref:hypothetical protein n=1 Tax=Micromonospora parastrephiae TaxID=2806101 RepID=UPI0038990AE6
MPLGAGGVEEYGQVVAAPARARAGNVLAAGTDLVFLSAGSDEIARVYLRVGFRRIGTACIAEPAALIP